MGKSDVAGNSVEDVKEFVVEGTSFNPSSGGIVGKTSLQKNMEVCTRLQTYRPNNADNFTCLLPVC